MVGFRTKELDVFIQDQHTPPFQYYLMREDKTDITLTSGVTKGDVIIAVSAGHGFLAAQTPPHYLVIMENDLYVQAKVISVTDDNITISVPSGSDFTTGATVLRGIIDMNINASGGEEEFVFNMRQGITPIDIQFASLTIWNAGAAGDDGKFGDLAELTNGMRLVKENTIDQGLGTYRANSDFREYGADIHYTDKSGGGGTYAVDITFDIKKVYGVVIRIDPRIPDILKAIINDALQTLDRLRIVIK